MGPAGVILRRGTPESTGREGGRPRAGRVSGEACSGTNKLACVVACLLRALLKKHASYTYCVVRSTLMQSCMYYSMYIHYTNTTRQRCLL